MRIIQLIQKPQLRGAEIFAIQLAEQLISQGHQVWIVSVFSGELLLPFSGELFFLNASPRKRLMDWTAWKKLAKLIQDLKPDLIQANSGDTLKYAGFSRFFFKWKSLLVFRNANLISGFITREPKRLFNLVLLNQCSGVASVSQLCLEDFKAVFPGWKGQMACLPIGVRKGEKTTLPADIQDFLNDCQFLVHVGSFVPEKNHGGLFRIFGSLTSEFPNLKLICLGSGPLQSQYESKGGTQILFAGSRTDVHEILPYAKALVMPSLIEGLPGAILEAMIADVPVVAYDVGGISEAIEHQKTGYLIPVGEEENFSKTLKNEILQYNPNLPEVIRLAKKKVIDRYLLDRVTLDFLGFYHELLKKESN